MKTVGYGSNRFSRCWWLLIPSCRPKALGALRPHTARAGALDHRVWATARSPAARGVAPGHAAERGCASESKVYDGKADEQVRYFGLAGHSRAQVAADLQLCADRTAAGGARAKKDDNRQAAEIEPQH